MAKKWTEGYLCRDQQGAIGGAMMGIGLFLTKPTLASDGLWEVDGQCLVSAKTWSRSDFLKIYKKSDLPGYGECIEVEIQL